MPQLMVTLDSGETVPLSDCDWVFRRADGQAYGCTKAVSGMRTLIDEGAAFMSFFDDGGYKRETVARVKLERAAGVTAELVSGERLHAFLEEMRKPLPKPEAAHA